MQLSSGCGEITATTSYGKSSASFRFVIMSCLHASDEKSHCVPRRYRMRIPRCTQSCEQKTTKNVAALGGLSRSNKGCLGTAAPRSVTRPCFPPPDTPGSLTAESFSGPDGADPSHGLSDVENDVKPDRKHSEVKSGK